MSALDSLRRRLLLAGAVAVPAVIAVACGGGSSHPAPPPAGYTGEFRLERYHTYLPASPPSPFLFAQATFQAPNAAYLPAGDFLTLRGPAGEVGLVRLNVFGRILYQPDPNLPDLSLQFWSPDSQYEISGKGSLEQQSIPAFDIADAIDTPAALEVLSPNFGPGEIATDATTDLVLAWTPGDGDYMGIFVAVATTAGQAFYLTYRPSDSGSFTIPANGAPGLNDLPVGIGSLTIERFREGSVVLPDGGTATTYGGDAQTVRFVRR